MPALASLSQADVDALAAQQAAEDYAGTTTSPAPQQAAPVAPPPAQEAPAPPPYDPAQDTQGQQAQPTVIAPATPEAAATNADASYAYGTGQPTYDTGVAPPESTQQTLYEPPPSGPPPVWEQTIYDPPNYIPIPTSATPSALGGATSFGMGPPVAEAPPTPLSSEWWTGVPRDQTAVAAMDQRRAASEAQGRVGMGEAGLFPRAIPQFAQLSDPMQDPEASWRERMRQEQERQAAQALPPVPSPGLGGVPVALPPTLGGMTGGIWDPSVQDQGITTNELPGALASLAPGLTSPVSYADRLAMDRWGSGEIANIPGLPEMGGAAADLLAPRRGPSIILDRQGNPVLQSQHQAALARRTTMLPVEEPGMMVDAQGQPFVPVGETTAVKRVPTPDEVAAPIESGVAPPPERTIFRNAPLNTTDSRFTLRPGEPGYGEAALLNSGDYTGIAPEAPAPVAAAVPLPPETPVRTGVAEALSPAITAERASRAAGKPPRPIVLPEDALVGQAIEAAPTERAATPGTRTPATAEPVLTPDERPVQTIYVEPILAETLDTPPRAVRTSLQPNGELTLTYPDGSRGNFASNRVSSTPEVGKVPVDLHPDGSFVVGRAITETRPPVGQPMEAAPTERAPTPGTRTPATAEPVPTPEGAKPPLPTAAERVRLGEEWARQHPQAAAEARPAGEAPGPEAEAVPPPPEEPVGKTTPTGRGPRAGLPGVLGGRVKPGWPTRVVLGGVPLVATSALMKANQVAGGGKAPSGPPTTGTTSAPKATAQDVTKQQQDVMDAMGVPKDATWTPVNGVRVRTSKDAAGNNVMWCVEGTKYSCEPIPDNGDIQAITAEIAARRGDSWENVGTGTPAKPSTGTTAAPVEAAAYEPPPEGESISPGSVGTPQTTAAPVISPEGDIPLVAPDGTNTDLVLTKDGDVKQSSGGSSGGSYRGGYSSGGSSYRSGGSSYSRRKKKKKTSGTSTAGMWPGFPFNRPPSPIRQQILDAIAASKAKGATKKGS